MDLEKVEVVLREKDLLEMDLDNVSVCLIDGADIYGSEDIKEFTEKELQAFIDETAKIQ